MLQDPVEQMVYEVVSRLDREYHVSKVWVEYPSPRELVIRVLLKPRTDGATVSVWRLIEMEERIATRLGIAVELSHARVGYTDDGLLLVFMFRTRP